MSLIEPGEVSTEAESFLSVCAMTLDDIPAVISLEERSFPTPWSALSYRRELQKNDLSHYWVIRNVAPSCALPPLLAYGGYWILGEEAHISTIASHPDYRRCKLGEWLLLKLMADARQHGAREVTLEVRVSNAAAIGLYLSLGFQEVGIRKQYYSSTWARPAEDALLLTIFALDEGRIWLPLVQRAADVEARSRQQLLARCG